MSKAGADWNQLAIWFGAYREGDATVTDRLFSSLHGVLLGYFSVRMRGHADAADIVQATLLKIHFSRDRFDADQSLKTWVFTIAARTLVDHWRQTAKERNRQELEIELPDGEFDSTVESLPSALLDPAMQLELQADLGRAVDRLKPMDRSIVYLSAMEGLSVGEIAEVHGLTEGAAKVRAHRAFKALRKVLELS